MIRRWLPFTVGIGIVVWLAALVMLAMTAEGPFRRAVPGSCWPTHGVIALLVRRRRPRGFVRDQAPACRLASRGRTLLMFGGLAIAPLLLVFAFSVTFLTRGIDSWFHAEVRQGLTDALGLSRAALDLRMREYLDRTSRMATRLDGLEGSVLYLALDEELRSSGAEELIVTSAGGQSIAYSRAGMVHALPAVPPEELLLQLRQGRPHVSLQPAQGGGYQVLAATPIRAGPGAQGYLLVATYPVPQRLSDLAGTVQQAYQQYGQLSFLREPLKATFVLTLSLVLLMAVLAAMYGALYFSERLVRPVQDLIAGTRAVAKGDFDTRLLRPSHDEIGFLVTSFNDMTKKLARAREETERSQAAVEAERAALAAILARLTSGVISDGPSRARCNQAAGPLSASTSRMRAGCRGDRGGQPPPPSRTEVPQRPRRGGRTERRERRRRTETGRRDRVRLHGAARRCRRAGSRARVDEVTQPRPVPAAWARSHPARSGNLMPIRCPR
jgi:nitrogen fixation/metabolism regulation signal transduction histidine kinase